MEKIAQLQQELYGVLKKPTRHRRIIAVSRLLCYGGALVYFIAMIAVQVLAYSGGDMSFLYTLNPEPTFWEQYKLLVFILPLFALIIIGGFGVSYFNQKYMATEQTAIRRIIGQMFPNAKCKLLPSYLPVSNLLLSNFFGGLDRRYVSGYSYGAVTFEDNNRSMTFHDILVNEGKLGGRLSQTSVGGFLTIFTALYRGIFAGRIENISGSFRGMFASAQLEKKITGSVVVLPDHLERHLDYLAKNIQALKNVNGNKLVTLEDVEFERYFAVYAGDEITARYVLTPAMMMRMTELKRKYNRDIMLSFNFDRFYFAVAMPEGFLTLGNASLTSGEALKDLYDNFMAAQDILNDLKLK
jgi:hypothetical protein